jgi:hypothetical protein
MDLCRELIVALIDSYCSVQRLYDAVINKPSKVIYELLATADICRSLRRCGRLLGRLGAQ